MYTNDIRIKSIEMMNFHNVNHGIIKFNNSDCDSLENGKGSICGIYGLNALDKSSIFVAISIMKEILAGNALDYNTFNSYIKKNADYSKINYTFSVCNSNDNSSNSENVIEKAEIEYSVCIRKIDNEENKEIHVFNEILKAKVAKKDGTKIPMKTYFETGDLDVDDSTYLNTFKKYVDGWCDSAKKQFDKCLNEKYDKQKSFIFTHGLGISLNTLDERDEYLKRNNIEYQNLSNTIKNSAEQENHFDMEALRKKFDMLLQSEKTISYYELFNFNIKRDEISLLNEIIKALDDSKINLITTEALTDYNTDNVLPLYISRYIVALAYSKNNIDEMEGESLKPGGLLNLKLGEKAALQINIINLLQVYASIIELSNLIKTIIPSLSIEIRFYDKRINKIIDLLTSEKDNTYFESLIIDGDAIEEICDKYFEDDLDLYELNDVEYTVIIKNDEREIPLSHISSGTRRIISLCSTLKSIYISNSSIVAINNADEDMFDNLLSKFIETLVESAKGQVIFASNDSKPLGSLKPTNIYYTEVDLEQ